MKNRAAEESEKPGVAIKTSALPRRELANEATVKVRS
jgi:hypothetical protein